MALPNLRKYGRAKCKPVASHGCHGQRLRLTLAALPLAPNVLPINSAISEFGLMQRSVAGLAGQPDSTVSIFRRAKNGPATHRWGWIKGWRIRHADTEDLSRGLALPLQIDLHRPDHLDGAFLFERALHDARAAIPAVVREAHIGRLPLFRVGI